jgi:hypothetical protein
MSDFFGNLNGGGIRLPEARFNDGGMLPPLSTAGYGNGLDGTADARINAASSLLGDVAPYVYGTSDRLTTQTAYLNTPHNIQKIIPQIMLPDCAEATLQHTFLLPHAVSDGDIAFAMRFVTRNARDSFLVDIHTYMRQGAARAIDYICNITTVNYILRGLQSKRTNPAWSHFATALGPEVQILYEKLQNKIRDEASAKSIEKYRSKLACVIFRDICRPIGVVIGSDKQGGQHQGRNKSVTFPVDFVATISVDGRNENLCNFWKSCDVNSGEDLLLQLRNYKSSELSNIYSLNTHKYNVHKEFMQGFEHNLYQISPVTRHKLFTNDDACSVLKQGYWHFAMSQKMHRMRNDVVNVTEIEQYHRGGLLQVTISPHFVRDVDAGENEEGENGEVEELGGGAYKKGEVVYQIANASELSKLPLFMQKSSEMKRKQQVQATETTQKRVKFSFLPHASQSIQPSQSKMFTFTENPSQSMFTFTEKPTQMFTFTEKPTQMFTFIEKPLQDLATSHVVMQVAAAEQVTAAEQVAPKTEPKSQGKILVTPRFATAAVTNSTPTATVKSRVKATRLGTDPSAADTNLKGSRL